MPWRINNEFLYQVFALLLAVIVVHGVYIGLIRPTAAAQLAAQAAQQAAGDVGEAQRTLAIVIRDFEQEACFILLLWALAVMGLKANRAKQEQRMLGRKLIDIPAGTSLLPQDSREYARVLEALPHEEQEFLLPPHAYERTPAFCYHSISARRIRIST